MTTRTTNRAAFTLTELMVSVVVLILILGIVAAVYQAAGQAVRQANATSEIYQHADALRDALHKDLASLVEGGYLYLRRRNYDNMTERDPSGKIAWTGLGTAASPWAADILAVSAAGSFKAYTSDNQSNMAQVLYQQADNVSPPAYGDGVLQADPAVNRWVLCRRATLYVPGAPGTTRELDNRTLSDQMYFVRDNLTGSMTPILAPDLRFDVPQQDWYTVLAPQCGMFRIEYLDDTSTWRDPPAVGTYFYRGGPNPLPQALRFTVRLYDRDLSVASYDNYTGGPIGGLAGTHGGLTFRFVIKLPD